MNRTVGLIAATLTGNHGAEAMAATVIGRLRDRHPELRFVLFSYYPQADRRALAAEHVEIASSTPLRLVLAHLPGALLAACLPRRWRAASWFLPAEVRRLSACAVLIDLAGVSFIDGREKFLPFNMLTILPALLLGVPVVKASQALGPFGGALNRAAARTILPRCAVIAARGGATKAHLESLGLHNLIDAPDVTFLMEEADRLVAVDQAYVGDVVGEIRRIRASGPKVVGVCPSSVIYAKSGAAYLDSLGELVARIAAEGCAIVLVPNATRMDDPQRLRNNDVPVIRLLKERLAGLGAATEAIVIDRDIDAISIKQVIAACDVMVVSRFHAMIAGLSVCRATIVFGWSHKYAEVMAIFGLSDWVFDYTRLDPSEIYPKLTELVKNSESVSRSIAAAVPQVRTQAMRQIEAIDTILKSARIAA